ncbi:hybrid sensor histidine kinase/response regulator [Polyangium jinanense]|uniref:histidine kinase n=1 Tax=Polyangium jinanense TaxID=2829994 RepID=A0A9X3X7X3_9BACT|nr:response regulator [Polyangium jinanense]MDC3960419.1 response regulator [Polyangium jinanense]MDC3985337.1 response regulator [Polyangium jinanense]
MRFLVLDDNPDDRLVAIRLLSHEFPDAQADEVFDKAGFEQALARDGYDAVVTDYMMRWTDGIQVLQLIKRHWPDCPVVLFTGSGNEEVAVEAMKSGADDYVVKSPQRMARLPLAVRHAIDRATAKRRLTQVETHLQRLTDALDVGVFRATAEGELLFCNPAFLRIIGQSTLAEARAGSIKALLSPPGQADKVRDTESGQTMAKREMEVRRPDGSRVWARVSERVGEEDRRTVVDGLVEDISERKALEEGLRARTEELQEADRRKDEFLAMLAHELRNPLAPILNAATIVRYKTAPLSDATVQEACVIIERQVMTLSRLVDDLLDVSRVSQGKITLHPEIIDLGRAVTQAVEMVRPLVESRRQALVVQLPPAPVQVRADLTRLTQVFANLLNNAAKFTPQGGQLGITATREGAEVVVRITDTGMGIDAALLPRIFDLFTQGDVSLDRAQGGLGVGLTLVKRLVEMHGGAVMAESAGPGRGSAFTVRLPASNGEAAGHDSESRAVVEGAKGLRVLVVDDNQDSAETVSLLLEMLGHEVERAYDGPSALAMARGFRPTVVFLDLGLPGMDGYEVARQLRRESWGKEIRLVALSGYGRDEDRERSRAAGCDLHLTKPPNFEVVRQLLDELGHARVGRPA